MDIEIAKTVLKPDANKRIGNVIKTRDDRDLVVFSQNGELVEGCVCPWIKEQDGHDTLIKLPEDNTILRERIEPWLTALFQSEHLNLLCGSGLTNAISLKAGSNGGANMGKCDFSVFKDEIETSAKSKAKKAGRDEGNIEDQIRTAIELLRGLEIQNSPEAVKLQQDLNKVIRNDVFGKLRKSVGFNAMIGDVLSYEQPQSYLVEDTEYTNEGTPVLTANKAFVLGYTSEIEGIYDKGDCVIFDDFTLDCKYVDFFFKVKSSAIKILTAKNKELLRYTFEFLKYLDLSTEEHKRHYITETQNQEFILPTVQIVRTIAHAFYALSLWKETIVKQRYAFEKQKQYLLRQMFI